MRGKALARLIASDCGANLRILCTTVDSDRTSIAATSQEAYTSVLYQFTRLSGLACVLWSHGTANKVRYQVATTALPNATVMSVRLTRHVSIPALGFGVLPTNKDNKDSMTIALGTTGGAFPISTDSTPSGVAAVASAASTLSDYLISVTDADLNGGRSLLVQYLCQDCQEVHKSAKEIVSLLLIGVSALLGNLCVSRRALRLIEQLGCRALHHGVLPRARSEA